MYRKNLFRLLFCAFAAFAVALSASAQTQAGAIKAMRVTGDVIKLSVNGMTTVVSEGQTVSESDTIITRASASVVLVFANGSSVRLDENSRLAVDEFKMDPLAETISVGRLDREPSVSKTRLNLAYGEMVGNVKKLSGRSSYDIKTPVGAAGIRGTTFRIIMRFNAAGQATFQLATSEGRVDFNPSVAVTGSAVSQSAGNQISVTDGTEVTAVAQVNPTTGVVTSITLTVPSTMPAATVAAINAVLRQEIVVAQTTGVFTPTEQQNAGSQQQQASTPSQGPGSNQQPATNLPSLPDTTIISTN